MLPPHLQELLTEAQVALPEHPNAVLLVDDEPENLEVLRALLSDRWHVITAPSGETALELIEAGLAVDLVIADQRMPGMTGIELLAVLARSKPEMARIVLTAYGDLETMLDAVNRAAAWRFLTKPYEPEELRATVEEALRAKHGYSLLGTLSAALTERRNALESTVAQLRNTQRQLFAAERLSTVGAAAAGIVHNLRNLSTIMTMLMAEFSTKDAPKSVLGPLVTAQAQMDSLVELLENLRQLARAQDHGPQLCEVDVPQLVRTTAALASMQRAGRPVHTDFGSCPPHALLDAARIQLALLALLDNAARACAEAAPVVLRTSTDLRTDASRTGAVEEWLTLEVADQGCGMDPSLMTEVARPFFSGFDPPGLGLGLEIARLVAHSHGGKLELCSDPGQGTRARIHVPTGVSYARSGIRL